MRRVRLTFAGRVVVFADRDKALRQVGELAERGTYPVHVIYGPEGCGKTALLQQARAILEEDYGYHVLYVNPLAEEPSGMLQYTPTLRELVREALAALPDPYARLADAALSIAAKALRRLGKPRLAVLMDDIFQAIGLERVKIYTKALLNLIEYPPGEYERMVVLVTSSEGLSMERIGRHSWATIRMMWNMPRSGFEQLYAQVPQPKPPVDEAWRWTGGNPRYLGRLFKADWNTATIVEEIIRGRRLDRLAATLTDREAEILEEAIENPDRLFERLGEPEAQKLERRLVELNMIAEVWDRSEHLWFDEPPPERDPGLGIGRFYAWQTPLHREAVKRALEETS